MAAALAQYSVAPGGGEEVPYSAWRVALSQPGKHLSAPEVFNLVEIGESQGRPLRAATGERTDGRACWLRLGFYCFKEPPPSYAAAVWLFTQLCRARRA